MSDSMSYVGLPLRTETLSQQVSAYIQDAIVRGELKPGEAITEASIVEKLQVSRAPIREALRTLSVKGLVTFIPRKGVFVSVLSQKELDEIYSVRLNLEYLALQRAVTQNCDQVVQELRKSLRQQEALIASGDLTAYIAENVAFHNVFAIHSDNNFLATLLKNIEERTLRYRVSSLRLPGRMNESYRDHKALVQSLEVQDVDSALKILSTHILSSKEEIENHVLSHEGGIS